MRSHLYWQGLKSSKKNALYSGFEDHPLQTEDEMANMTEEERDNHPQILVGLISAMSEGLTLTRAKRIIMMEPISIPTAEEQCEGRCHRIGQHEETASWRLSCTGDKGVSSETHVKQMADFRMVFAEDGDVWNVARETDSVDYIADEMGDIAPKEVDDNENADGNVEKEIVDLTSE